MFKRQLGDISKDVKDYKKNICVLYALKTISDEKTLINIKKLVKRFIQNL